MATTLPNDDHFKRLDAASYDPVQKAYDRFTEAFTTPLAQRIVELAAIRPTDRVLDVATGTGVVVRAIAAGHRPAGGILGVDLSDGMLATAREKAAAVGHAIEFLKTDAEALDLPDKSFDVVLSLFGLMHFPHPDRAIAQMYRVLKPGGRVVIGVGSSPARDSFAQVGYASSRAWEMVERARGRWLAAPGYLDDLVRKHIPAEAEIETADVTRSGHPGTFLPRLVRAAGFENLQRSWQGYAPEFKTAEEFWELQATYSTFARKRLSHATPTQAQAVKDEFFATCQAVLGCGGRLVYRYGSLYVSAQRPV
jgi:ubiquinone/menaquinone biosynthesis C-methylase UbiE